MRDAEDLAMELHMVDEELAEVEHEIERLLGRQQALLNQRERLQQRLAAEERAPKADWQGAFEWDGRVEAALRDVFHLPGFRPLQREVINATLQGRDCLCLLPAGGGKSLTYQLPAVIQGVRGVTLVVSPLLALIHDQVLGLTTTGIQAASLTSMTSKEEAAEVNKLLDDPHSGLRLLFVTPEKIVNSKRFMARLEKMYRAGRLERIAIDEAHCCSQWGNDFRPDYKKLGVLRQQFPNTPILALTATATERVCDDLRQILRIEGCEVFRSPTNRDNLYYEVVPKPASAEAVAEELAGWVQANYPRGESGIVYCLTRKDCETVAQQLRERGLSCAHYHADMDHTDRQRTHSMWSEGKVQVIVATVAFGMGINKADVQFVIHHSLSKSIENYYQESGRAGRDRKPARCRLYFRLGDYLRQAGVVVMEPGWDRNLNAMLRYVASPGCRRTVIARHFGESPPPCHDMCDMCACKAAAAAAAAAQPSGSDGSVMLRRDVTAAAVGALNTLTNWVGAEKRATLNQLVDKWRASKEHGAAAKAVSRDECEAVIQQLVLEGCLQLDFGFTAYATNVYLKVGPTAGAVLKGKQQVHLTLPPGQQPAAAGGAQRQQAGGAQRQQQAGKAQQQQEAGKAQQLAAAGEAQQQAQQRKQGAQLQKQAQHPRKAEVVEVDLLSSSSEEECPWETDSDVEGAAKQGKAAAASKRKRGQ